MNEQEKAEEIALLNSAIKISGLSVRRFASSVVARDERLVFRWIAGDATIPRAVVKWMESYVAEHANSQPQGR